MNPLTRVPKRFRAALSSMIVWVLLLILGCLCACSQTQSEVAFTIPERDLIPEGMAYDPVEKAFYVSSTYKRKIVKIDSSGASSDFTNSAQDGLWGVVGMEVDPVRRVLWAASSHAGTGMPMVDMDPDEEGTAGIFKYDLTTGKLIKKYVLGTESEHHFLNDLTVSSQGTVYVTDSRERALYTISAERDSLAVFLNPPDMASPNGITLSEDERLLFIALNGEVGRVVLSTGTFSLLRKPEEIEIKADGLYFFEESLIAIWPWSEGREVSRYQLNASLDAIERVEILEGDHPAFIQPTTGVIVERDLYYIANSQLQAFSRLYNEESTDQDDPLQEPVILRLALGD